MQIHELNNFTGTLGSGAYLAIDDGNDTGKISSQGLLAATEARIDNIIAGPAPSAEEIVDARLGDDGVTYPSLGDAIRDQFSDVKSDIDDEAIARTNADAALQNEIGTLSNLDTTHKTNLVSAVNELESLKVNIPLDGSNQPTNGTNGQLLRTKGDGSTEWVDEGLPTDEQTAQAVSDWLDDHPEATTSVQDWSLTYKKLVKGTLGYVTPEMYGAKGDGVTDDTEAIQKAFDSGVDVIWFDSRKTYLVSKADNSSLYPDNDEPCVYLNNKHNMTICGNNALLKVNAHGQGVLEIINSENIKVQDLRIMGHGLFPAIAPNGRAEKGDASGGYYKSGYDWEAHKNNSVDTSGFTGVNGDASAQWGTFGNGYIGNAGIGILIENGCEKITIENCSIDGFNYSGISVGFRGHSDYEYNTDILISNCRVSNCYDDGINLLLVDGVTIENSFIENIGHPDARPVNENSAYSYTYADPGYGITCRTPYTSASRAKNVKVINNIIQRCVRKGVDSHSVDCYTIKGNQISLCYVAGIEMSGTTTESSLSYNVLIDSNILEYCGLLGNAINQYIATGSGSLDANDYEINVIISNNILKNCSMVVGGVINVRIGKNTSVVNNIVSGTWDLGTVTDAIISVGQSDRISESIRVAGNNISLPNSSAPYAIHTINLKNGIVANNIANMQSCSAVLYAHGSLANEVDIIGNSLYAESYTNAPSYTTNTGKVVGNTMSGSTRGYKIISGKYTSASGYFIIEDASIKKNTSAVVIMPQYNPTTPFNINFTTDIENGRVVVYTRKTNDASAYNGEVSVKALIINNV